MNRKEQERLVVLNQVEMGKMIGKEAAELLNLSLRHVRRILAAYRKEGAAALAHGNRGRKPHNALGEGLKKRVLELGQSTYAGCNNQHFTELLAEREGINFSRSSVRELRIADAKTTEEANRVLWDYLPRFNQRFAVPAREPGLAYRQAPEGFKPDEVFCFKYQCTVGKDNVVRFGQHRLQIMPTNGRLSYTRVKVEVHERIDGSMAVYYKGQCLLTKPALPEALVLRVRNITHFTPGSKPRELAAPVVGKVSELKLHHPYKPAPNHPWRGGFKMYVDKRG